MTTNKTETLQNYHKSLFTVHISRLLYRISHMPHNIDVVSWDIKLTDTLRVEHATSCASIIYGS